ncbi:hypothetical protein, partial [Bartonella sp. CL48QHWL]|uniref:hypothetical protein n=1 Tax=Bartonella sp. CL48QHWL TaxID=3243535 RepID=UPI0035CEE52B
IQDACSITLTFAVIPCTFYNISEARKNNRINVKGFNVAEITLPDGLYDVLSFSRVFADKLKEKRMSRGAVRFDVEEPTGKAILKFIKRKNEEHYQIYFLGKSNELFGLKSDWPYPLDNKTDNEVVSDKPINFRPINYLVFHCDLIDSTNVLINNEESIMTPSDVLAVRPIKEANFGDLIAYSFNKPIALPCKPRFNKINIYLTDENGEIIDLNGYDVQYQLVLTHA